MKILYILNGNLVLNHRYNNLKKIISEFNIRLFKGKPYHTIIKFKEQQVLPTLNDGWFSGFADAEGCFYCPIETKRRHVSHYISIVFEIGQNGETWFFSYIQSLFSGGIIHPKNSSDETHNRIYFKGYSKVTKIITYFDKFGVKTEHKYQGNILWKEIYNSLVLKEHLDKNKLFVLVAKAQIIN